MSTADQNQMNALHQLVAKQFKDALEGGEITPALLSSAAKFLKDNNVVLIPESQSALDEVAKKYEDLENMDDEDDKHLPFPDVNYGS